MIYYHGSNTLYDFPSFKFVDNWTPGDHRAVKVVLGYYVTPNRQIAESCGKYVYEIRMKPRKPFNWLLNDMKKFYEDTTRHCDESKHAGRMRFFRNAMSMERDLINIIEHDGSIGECIIVNLNGIESFRCVNLGTN